MKQTHFVSYEYGKKKNMKNKVLILFPYFFSFTKLLENKIRTLMWFKFSRGRGLSRHELEVY